LSQAVNVRARTAIVISVKIFFIAVWILFDLTFDGAKVRNVFPMSK
jgi:hypothetical protein